jgi:hypothetical protein
MNAIKSAVSDIRSFCARRTASVVALFTVFSTLAVAGAAQADASPTTGIDWVADLVTPVKSELTLVIAAGLGVLVVIVAVKAGIRLVRGFMH